MLVFYQYFIDWEMLLKHFLFVEREVIGFRINLFPIKYVQFDVVLVLWSEDKYKKIDLKNNNNSQACTVSIKIREYGMNDNETFIF